MLVVLSILITACVIIWAYDRGSKGVKLFDLILKIMVALVVLSFFGVVISMGVAGELPWNEIAAGFIPNFSLFYEPAEVYSPFLEGTGEFRSFWENKIINLQKDVMIAAAATAVGINMTFFMPFVLLSRKWGREHRGLAKFDLWTALLIPYVVATSCVVIAAGTQFNGKPESAYEDYENRVLRSNLAKGYNAFITERLELELGEEKFASLAPVQKKELGSTIPESDKQIAAMLVKRDARDLAESLKSLTANDTLSQVIFGIGVVGMALSTIIILMTINGHAICEVLGKPHKGPVFLGGAYIAGIGVLGPFVWNDAAFWLAVPTSILGFTLIPVAYLSFFLLINSKKVLGRERPKGLGRVIWNIGLILSLGIMGTAAFYVAWNKSWGDIQFGRIALIGFGILLLIGHFGLQNKKLLKKTEAMDLKFQQLKKKLDSIKTN